MSETTLTNDGGSAQDNTGIETNEQAVGGLDHPVGEATGQEYYGLPVLEDTGHPMVPEPDVDYIMRPIEDTSKTDVELLCKIMDGARSPRLIGDSGVGKNALVAHICAETNRPLAPINFGQDTTVETLIGMFQPKEGAEGEVVEKVNRIKEEHDLSMDQAIQLVTGASENFEWVDGLLTSAVKKGWVFEADELNAAPPEATMPLHGVTQKEANRNLTIQKRRKVIEPDDRFKFVATMNPPHFAGTHELNEAFKNRFVPMEIPHLEQKAESGLVASNSSLSEGEARKVVKLANRIRSQRKQPESGGSPKITTAISTRELLKIGELCEDDFMKLETATKMILKGQANPGDERAIMSAMQNTF